ncbi:MAG: hypothetical protein JW821_17630 [Deltaproteobacteria bacterium]|nr:hypothetical protein [Deltaproteobacteria bacterium]
MDSNRCKHGLLKGQCSYCNKMAARGLAVKTEDKTEKAAKRKARQAN